MQGWHKPLVCKTPSMHKVQQSKEPSNEVGYSPYNTDYSLNPHQITVEKKGFDLYVTDETSRHKEPLAYHTAEI